MSWIERINKGLEITTGDGKKYTPLYMNATKSFEYNIADFNFPNIPGTLVKRGEVMGTRFTLELFFQGEDNIEQGREFEISANDRRPWKLSHPIYDAILMHPSSIEVDNTGLNVAKYTVECLETIDEIAPFVTIDPDLKLKNDTAIQQEIAAELFAEDVDPEISDINLISNNTESIYNEGSKIVTDNDELSAYFNAFQTANAAILNGTSDVFTMISTIQAVIEAPALFQIGVQVRLDNLVAQMLALSATLENLNTKNQKTIYENNAGSVMMAMITAVANPIDGDYENATDVLNVYELILSQYNTYISNIQSIQSLSNLDPGNYIPRFKSLAKLSDIVEYALSNLLQIALGSKQQRSVILEYDSNLINLTHRFYGLSVSGDNIDTFKKINKIGLNEILQIRKGRRIVYYV